LLPIQWTPPADAPNAGVSLYYTHTSRIVQPGAPAGEGGVIAENLPAASGQYNWDMSFLRAGTYRVYARVSDTQQPVRLDANSTIMPGYRTVLALGLITLQDTTPPGPTTNLTLTPMHHALQACWDANPANDLAGYLLRYKVVNLAGQTIDYTLRVPATVAFEPTGETARQCNRIGGLNVGAQVPVSVVAYDASGNVSTGTATGTGTVGNQPSEFEFSPGTLTGRIEPKDLGVHLRWSGVQAPFTAKGYQVYYTGNPPVGDLGPSPINVGDTLSKILRGFQPGCTYTFQVQAYDHQGRLRLPSNTITMTLTNNVDGNSDGLPDDWASCHEIGDANADDDTDGLINRDEYPRGTDLQDPNSDDDLFSDGEEVACGSNPLDELNFCVDAQGLPNLDALLPRLAVAPQRLVFVAYTQGNAPQPQPIVVTNTGGGQVAPQATSDAAWLTTSITRGGVAVLVNQAGLSRGHYQGKITLTNAAGGATQNSPQTVLVDLYVYEGAGQATQLSRQSSDMLFLPLIQR
jgi:hypothetical protein